MSNIEKILNVSIISTISVMIMMRDFSPRE